MLRHFRLEGASLHDDDDRRGVTVLTDDERPVVFYGDQRRRTQPAAPQATEREAVSELLAPFAYDYMVKAMWVSGAGRRRLRLPLGLS